MSVQRAVAAERVTLGSEAVQRAVAAERVTLGSEVEVTQRGGAQGSGGVPLRTPSLDDVLTSVRG